MVKILIDKRLYNIKDEDKIKLLNCLFQNNQKAYNNTLKSIESSYPVKSYVDIHNYIEEK
jgi:hypothetical protein